MDRHYVVVRKHNGIGLDAKILGLFGTNIKGNIVLFATARLLAMALYGLASIFFSVALKLIFA